MTFRLKIRLPGSLTVGTLQMLLQEWPHDQPSFVEVDFGRQHWVEPVGTVALSCLLELAQRNGSSIEVTGLAGCRNEGYWARMRFFRNFGLAEPDFGRARNATGRFSEICRITDADDTDEIADRIVAAMTPSAEERQVYMHVVTEALNNVCQHSGSVGFCASQFYPQINVVRFAIGDCGVGLRHSLQNYGPATDVEAIKLALRVGITGRPAIPRGLQRKALRNRGVGLSAIEKLVTGNGGRLLVRSGTGGMHSWRAKAFQDAGTAWPGTLVSAEMKRGVSRGFHDIMRELDAELRSAAGKTARRPRRMP